MLKLHDDNLYRALPVHYYYYYYYYYYYCYYYYYYIALFSVRNELTATRLVYQLRS